MHLFIFLSCTVHHLTSHSFYSAFYCLAVSQYLCSHLLPLYFDFVLFCLYTPLPQVSPPLCFLVPHCLSLGEFWIRGVFWCQAATILHVNKKGWFEAQWELQRTFSSARLPCLVLLQRERVHILYITVPSSSEAAICGCSCTHIISTLLH